MEYHYLMEWNCQKLKLVRQLLEKLLLMIMVKPMKLKKKIELPIIR